MLFLLSLSQQLTYCLAQLALCQVDDVRFESLKLPQVGGLSSCKPTTWQRASCAQTVCQLLRQQQVSLL